MPAKGKEIHMKDLNRELDALLTCYGFELQCEIERRERKKYKTEAVEVATGIRKKMLRRIQKAQRALKALEVASASQG